MGLGGDSCLDLGLGFWGGLLVFLLTSTRTSRTCTTLVLFILLYCCINDGFMALTKMQAMGWVAEWTCSGAGGYGGSLSVGCTLIGRGQC